LLKVSSNFIKKYYYFLAELIIVEYTQNINNKPSPLPLIQHYIRKSFC